MIKHIKINFKKFDLFYIFSNIKGYLYAFLPFTSKNIAFSMKIMKKVQFKLYPFTNYQIIYKSCNLIYPYFIIIILNFSYNFLCHILPTYNKETSLFIH